MTRFIPFLVAILAAVIFIVSDYGQTEVIYDCREAHWHPDIPVEVKNQCRRIMKEYYEKEREERKIIRT